MSVPQSDEPHFEFFVATWSWWPPHWTVQVWDRTCVTEVLLDCIDIEAPLFFFCLHGMTFSKSCLFLFGTVGF